MVTGQHPPSLRRQDWGTILSTATTVWLIATVALLHVTWQLGTPWPPLARHLPHWGQALLDLALYHDLSTWQGYLAQLEVPHPHWHLTAHLVLPGLAALLLAIPTGRSFYTPGGRDGLRHIRGPRLYWYHAAIRHARRQRRQEGGTPGLALHPELTLSRTRESGNLLVVGAQGTGKTVFITPLMQQVIQRGERAFIYMAIRLCCTPAPWTGRPAMWPEAATKITATGSSMARSWMRKAVNAIKAKPQPLKQG